MKPRVAVLLLTIGLACVCLGQNVKTPAAAKTAPSQNPYPNELPGFKFYVRHFTPLRPYASDRTLVAKALGSDRDIELSRWKITPLFIGEGSKFNDHPRTKDITGRLASINMRPKQRVSMLGVTFPAVFTRSSGGISEVNVICDVYSDSFGLQYWLYAEDSAVGKKGDLMEIVYGPARRVERQALDSSSSRP
jgi:hypothetical protein